MIPNDRLEKMLDEASQLCRIFGQSLVTAKGEGDEPKS